MEAPVGSELQCWLPTRGVIFAVNVLELMLLLLSVKKQVAWSSRLLA